MENSPQDPIIFRAGKRLYLRPVEEGDLPYFVRWFNNAEITKFLHAFKPATIEDEREWFSSISKRKGSDLIFSIVLFEDHRLIGNTGLHRIDYRHGTATTGSVIGDQEMWQKGFGSEAKMVLLNYAFNTLNLRKINSHVYGFNARSKGHLEKCGYRQEGVQKDQFFVDGRFEDIINMAVFKEDWIPLWEKFRKEVLGEN